MLLAKSVPKVVVVLLNQVPPVTVDPGHSYKAAVRYLVQDDKGQLGW